MSNDNEEVRDAAFYEAHPDKLPDDPEELQRLITALEGGEPASEERSNPGANDGASASDGNTGVAATGGGEVSPEPSGETQAALDAETAEQDASEQEPVVATKSGRPVIPYEVLNRTRQTVLEERQARSRAENEAAELRSRLQQVAAGTPTQPQPDNGYDSLLEEFPTVKPLVDRLKALEQVLGDVQMRSAAEAQRREQVEREAVSAAVAEHPALLGWEAQANSDPTLWNAACQAYAALAGDPSLSELSVADRVARTEMMVKAAYGLRDSPPAVAPLAKQPIQVSQAAPPKPPPAAPVTTLSDIPGGTPVAANLMSSVETMSQDALAAKLVSMTPQQQDEFLARFG
jgi:hypothetical protein